MGGFMMMVVNIIIVSVPEQIALTIFALIFLGKFDNIEFKLSKIAPMMLIVILPLAILSNVLRTYFAFTSDSVMPLIGIISMSVLMIIYLRARKLKDIFRIILSTLVSFIILSIIQVSYVPLGIYGTDRDIASFNKPGLVTFLWTLPERVIEISIIIYILTKKKSFIKINTLKEVYQNKMLSIISLCILLFDCAFLFSMMKFIAFDKILVNLAFYIQLIIIILIIIFPVINITLLWAVVYNIIRHDTYERMLSKERLKALTSIMETFREDGHYDKVEGVLSDINKHVDKLYDDKK